MQSAGRMGCEFLHHDFAARRGEFVFGSHADNFRVIGIGNQQPGFGRQQLGRERVIHSPEEPVTLFQVAIPFVIRRKIRAG